jgi:hypothetical protein
MLDRNTAARKSKLWHPEPLAHGKLLHVTLHLENRKVATLQACLGDIRQTKRWNQASHSFPPATPRIDQHNPMGRLTPHTHTKIWSWKTNKEQKTHTQHWDWVAKSTWEKRGGARSWYACKQRLERQKGQEQACDQPLSEIRQVAVHKAHLLSQWAIHKVKQHSKIEK